ncbi:DUF4229 domain-containing protein [Subtercola boreus]|uniref:DUF4229 domain-containing protein n=1 Tax=Subtercola boreus TaxID=120213 RepID=A0A3E0WF42_9MICO|nr:DUF4229 domain-containing protein [Subtercola boreus]RFA23646.1 hypothetical protein B7R24_01885 [Subtercola boreus]RFA24040.1 hypothetical protein B7R23_01885 [Subtercola boreus]RFA29738.1 hypothetical protein B7R25_01880 [Subtercola boreus]
MKTGRTWVFYTLIRLGIFAVALAVLLLTQMTPWIAAVLAAVISLCASYIFLRAPREELATGLYQARHGGGTVSKRAPERAGSDEANEDAVVDGVVPTDGASSDAIAENPAPAPGDAPAR